MKTIKQLLQYLPEPARARAIANLTRHTEGLMHRTVSEAILYGFTWNNTPEGTKYWTDLYDIREEIEDKVNA